MNRTEIWLQSHADDYTYNPATAIIMSDLFTRKIA